MADRPILFSAPMVHALLAGRKTQTRRILRMSRYPGYSQFGPSDTRGYDWHLRDRQLRWHDLRNAELLKLLPYAFGDRLYVREAWRCEARLDKRAPRDIATSYPGVKYVATDEPDDFGIEGKFRQGMHMPRWASRLTLIVTDVRVQRLQEVSEADAAAEGVESDSDGFRDYQMPSTQCCAAARDSFRTLWDSLNAERGFGWVVNPWVVAVSFTVRQSNIDAEGSTP